jgi:hypothetical protein
MRINAHRVNLKIRIWAAARSEIASVFPLMLRKFRCDEHLSTYMSQMFPWELKPHRKAGRRSGRPVAPQPSLFREPLPRVDSPRLAERIKTARRREIFRRSSKDLRYE